MKEALTKISNVCKWIFGYGIMITLFLGGATFIGYVVALIVGGDTAATICTFISKTVNPIMIYTSTCLVLFGLLTMYLAGEKALTSGKKKDSKKSK